MDENALSQTISSHQHVAELSSSNTFLETPDQAMDENRSSQGEEEEVIPPIW
jgi:hypothetical protein